MKELKLWYDNETPFLKENAERKTKDEFCYTYGDNSDSGPLNDSGWECWSLPLGNGHMGVNVFGRKQTEKLQITENSLCNPYAYGEGGLMSFCLLYAEFPHNEFKNFKRYLSLDSAVSGVSYSENGVSYERKYFTSYPDNVLVMRFECDKQGKLDFKLRAEIPFLSDCLMEKGDCMGRSGEIKLTDCVLTLGGVAEYYGINYEGQLKISETDGEILFDGAEISVKNATFATAIFTLGTNYKMESRVFSEPDRLKKLACYPHPHDAVSKTLTNAENLGFRELLSRHLDDYRSLFGRVLFNISDETAEIPTDRLIKEYREGKKHPYLEELYFQYGRYLLICSSRKGTYPANLQGTWSQYKSSPWSSGYWHNINVQMNYWPAFNTNLCELFEPYAEYWTAYLNKAKTYADEYVKHCNPHLAKEAGNNGWTVGTGAWLYDISSAELPENLGHSGPATGALTSKLFWEYYAFSDDEKILKNVSLPAIEGMSKFLSKVLTERDGKLLAKYSASPENMHNGKHYHTVGCAFDQQLIWENHHDLLKIADILGIDNETVRTAREQIDKLDPVLIGKSGQIKEYREEEYYGDIGEYHHRHISQLMGLYPGTSITRESPRYIEAAKVSLEKRGDRSTGWATAHRLNAWARTGDGEHCYSVLKILLSKCTLNNLWDMHPPFQIDGNFGATAGIAEMLLQSHENVIRVIPSLPDSWKDGSFSGLTARGGFTVDAEWQNKKLSAVRITAKHDKVLKMFSETEPKTADVPYSFKDGVLTAKLSGKKTVRFTF